MNKKLLRPEECTKKEIDIFYRMLICNPDIKRIGLKKRIKQSVVLLFCYDFKNLTGIGAIKKPDLNYIKKIYTLAKIDRYLYNLEYEIGYLYIDKNYRSNGISKRITESLITYYGKNLFAVIRIDNNFARNNLLRFGFKKIGSEYKGNKYYFEIFYSEYKK